MAKILLLLITCSLFFWGSAIAQELRLTDEMQTFSATPYLFVFEDKNRESDIEQITSSLYLNQFTPSTTRTLGFTFSSYWIKLDITSKTAQTKKWYLTFNQHHTKRIHVYGKNTYSKQLAQALQPFEKSRNSTYLLHLSNNIPYTVYIQIADNKNPISLDINIVSDDKLIENIDNNSLLFGLIIGSILTLGIYNLMIYFTLHPTFRTYK
jgi:hypothetical protein